VEKVRQFGKTVVADRVCRAVNDEESGVVAAFAGALRDEFLGQRVVKEFGREPRSGKGSRFGSGHGDGEEGVAWADK